MHVREIVFRFPAGTDFFFFFFFQNAQTGFGVHTAFYFVFTGGYFASCKASNKVNCSLLSSAELKNAWSHALIHAYA